MESSNFYLSKKYFLKISNRFLNSFLISIFLFSISLAAPKVTITPPTQNVNLGQKATVKIVTTGANKCTVTGGNYNGNNTILNGQVLLTPTRTSTYIFECSNTEDEKDSMAVTVTVLGTTPANVSPVTPANTIVPPANNSQTTNQNNNSQNSPSFGRAPTPQYQTGTVLNEANSICSAYSGFQSVYAAASAGGGSAVPVDLTQLRPVLEAINRNTQLTANEMRAADMIRFCRVLPNIAAASNRLAQNTAKQLKTIADNCSADEKCYAERKFKKSVEREIKNAESYGSYARDVQKLLLNVAETGEYEKKLSLTYTDANKTEYCSQQWAQKRNPIECILVPTKGELIKDAYYYSISQISNDMRDVSREFANDGVAGSEICIKTYDGKDPSNVSADDPNCEEIRRQPALVNREILKQITALPYTQAYSPAAELGFDPTIDNISTRIRDGNLIDPDISSNFGSIQGGGVNPITGGGAVNAGTDMKSVEPNYLKLQETISVIVTLYDVTRAAYASSTSICRNIPVANRSQTITRIDAARKTYSDYGAKLKTDWENALAKPNENHLALVTQINFDLKDKYTLTLKTQVLDASKALLQICVDAAAKAAEAERAAKAAEEERAAKASQPAT